MDKLISKIILVIGIVSFTIPAQIIAQPAQDSILSKSKKEVVKEATVKVDNTKVGKVENQIDPNIAKETDRKDIKGETQIDTGLYGKVKQPAEVNNTKEILIEGKVLKYKPEIIDHSIWNDLLQKYVSTEGMVNYKGLKKDQDQVKKYTSMLSVTEPGDNWSKEQQKAYWMNAYNAFTIQLILNNYPLKSIKDLKNPWGNKFFTIGNKEMSLEQIEHEILRKMGDPRIHFGINCASISCPPLSNTAFTKKNVDKELQKLAANFINDSSRNKISQEEVEISKIFKWFDKDFKTNGSLVDYISKYSETTIKKGATVKYKEYNWNLNEQ